ncbi:MAG: hypothetical protein ACYC64_12035, partial [Armatimonadota bacterium]
MRERSAPAICATELILSRLQGAKKSGNGYIARCPAHDDQQASLSVSEGEEGQCLIHCHAGCETTDVLAAIGLKLADLYPKGDKSQRSGKLPPWERIENVYSYVDAAGEVKYESVRLHSPKSFSQRRPDPNNPRGYVWNMAGVTPLPYQLPAVLKAIADNHTIFVVEGEKDCHTLRNIECAATTNHGGAGHWKPQITPWFKGAKVIIVPDNDVAGCAHAMDVAGRLHGVAASVKYLLLPGLLPKQDVSDWLKTHTPEEFFALVESASAWTPGTLIQPSPDAQAQWDAAHTRKSNPKPADIPGEGGFTLSDLGNAERLIAAHGANLRYNVDSGRWLVWNKQCWKPDLTGEVDRLARQTIRGIADEIASIYAQISNLADSNERERMRKRAESLSGHMKNSESRSRLDAMIALARYCAGVPVTTNQLDADGWLLNSHNGTIDLLTGRLKPYDPHDLITKMVPVDYDPNAKCPTWERVISEIFAGDSDLVSFVQRAIGYSLTTDTSEQGFFLLH